MEIITKPVEYSQGGATFEGIFAANSAGKKPTILICHQWAGRSDFEVDTAKKMAEWGYSGFAVDVFGKGVRGQGPEECTKLITPLLQDRETLQARLLAAVEAAKAQPENDGRVVAIGFCFGGLCAIDLARIGADILGAVSFHGNLTPPGDTEGKTLKGKVLALHGWDDPLVPNESAVAFGDEMTKAGADWQLHNYGGTVHSFMMPGVNFPQMGAVYNPVSARRGWATLKDFLAEIL